MKASLILLVLAVLFAVAFAQNSTQTPEPKPYNRRATKREKFDVTGIVSGQDTIIISNGNKIKNKEKFILNLGPKINSAVDIALSTELEGKVVIKP